MPSVPVKQLTFGVDAPGLAELIFGTDRVHADRNWVGGTPAILAVLHTWSRTLEHHPQVHLLVTAGGLAADGSAWIKPAHPSNDCPGPRVREGMWTSCRVSSPMRRNRTARTSTGT